jgi:hypothetical protein
MQPNLNLIAANTHTWELTDSQRSRRAHRLDSVNPRHRHARTTGLRQLVPRYFRYAGAADQQPLRRTARRAG